MAVTASTSRTRLTTGATNRLLALFAMVLAMVGAVKDRLVPSEFATRVRSRRDYELRQAQFNAGNGMIERIAGGVITIAVVVIVLNQLFTLSIVNNTTGPFSGLMDSVENIGSAALTLIVVGFLAAAAGAVLAMFRGGF